MRSDDIDPTRATSKGARYLKEFLHYAETLELSTPEVDDKALIQSPFERAVYDELTTHGLRLIPQVGQASYRIDFGVLDQDLPGRFVVGIECDGATYHSASTARDRDRLRQHVLEDLGWTLIRVWSTDWYQNRDAQVKRILEFVAEQKNYIKAEPESKVTSGNQASQTNAPEKKDIRQRELRASVFDVRANPQHVPTALREATSAKRKLIDYRLSHLQTLGDPQAFNSASEQSIMAVIQTVVNCEAPIHVEELKRRVAACWQISRVGSRISARIDKLIGWMAKKEQIILRKEFVWKSGQTKVDPRVRRIDGYVFTAETLPPEELDSFIAYVLDDKRPRSREEIVTEVAKAVGFGRAGQKLAETIQTRIQYLLDSSLIEPCSTGIRLTDASWGQS